MACDKQAVCNKCSLAGKLMQSIHISRLPLVLLMQLKRCLAFKILCIICLACPHIACVPNEIFLCLTLLCVMHYRFTFENGVPSKVRKQVCFPMVLKAPDVVCSTNSQDEYKLKGVVYHRGETCSNGHYVSCCLRGSR